MDNLDITPAFIDIFNRINKHLDLLPFQKLLNDQNSTLSIDEKESLKSKINESAKKMRQLNQVLDELKYHILDEMEKVRHDYEEKNRDLDALEAHLNYVRQNKFKTSTAVLKAQEQQINTLEDLNENLSHHSGDQDYIDTTKKENMNLFMNQASDLVKKPSGSNLPKKSLKKPTNHLKILNPIESNTMKIGGHQKKVITNSNEKAMNYQMNDYPMGDVQQKRQKQPPAQQPKKEKNVDNIYINYPQINYISLSEFNYIPKYMRGRLSFETCNKLVDEFNKAIESKYKFMMILTSKYSSEELIKYTLYKNQEDDETRGLFFVTPKDLHDYSELKISMNNTKIFLQCVRHCKRIKEIRGMDKLIRYVVLNC